MLKHLVLKNIEVSTHLGKVNFDDKGLSTDLSPNQQKSLGKLNGFKYIDEEEQKKKEEEAKKKEKELLKKAKAEDEAIEKEKEDAAEKAVVDDSIHDPVTENQVKPAPKKRSTPRKRKTNTTDKK